MKRINCVTSKNITPNIVYWGFSQWYKWRWNWTHIDMGIISIYKLKNHKLWAIMAFLIWPMRVFYHSFFAGGFKNYK